MTKPVRFFAAREQAGLSIEAAAKLTGCTPRTVHRWDSGEIIPKPPVFDRIESYIRDRAAAEKQSRAFTFIDLFAGIGGIRRALEAAGGECKATCEWDKYARMTYAKNFSVDHPFIGDIREVTRVNRDLNADADDEKIDREIPDHDVLAAGFPCQPFSIAGVSKKNALGRPHGFADEAQGTLFYDVARIIKVKKPKAFLLENVKNLVRHDRGNTFRVIMDVLRNELKYSFVDHRVIDAKGFVPQHRERTIIVGFREDVGFDFGSVRIPSSKTGPKLSSILHNSNEMPEEPYTLGPKCRVNPKYTLTENLWVYLQNYAKKHRAAGNGFGCSVVDGDNVARTLSARYYKDGSEILIRQRGSKPPRRLTPRECARLMGFDRPGQPLFQIPVSDMQAYKQFGNSVAVPVIEAVARELAAALSNADLVRSEPLLPLFSSGRRQPADHAND